MTRKAFALILVLASMLQIEQPTAPDIEVLELFAGTARLCRLAKAVGLPTAAHDVSYDLLGNQGGKSAMDINESAGYLLLVYPYLGNVLFGFRSCSLTFFVRLTILTLLRTKFAGCVCLMGVCCSSWVVINVGTSQRTQWNPMGSEDVRSVRASNKMVSRLGTRGRLMREGDSRCTLVIMFLVASGSIPLVENPASSLLFHHDRLKWLTPQLRTWGINDAWLAPGCLWFPEVWRQPFWMKLYGHLTWKRTKIWSTAFSVFRLNLGRLDKRQHRCEVATARKYVSKVDGKVRFGGTKSLKATQCLGPLRGVCALG